MAQMYVAGSTDNHVLQRENHHVADTNVLLPDKLNTFFARFEDNTVPPTWPATKDCGLSFSVVDVSKMFKRFNLRKAAGPDGIPCRVPRACAGQLAVVFPDILNLSLSQSVVPTYFKMSTIVPVPKKAKVTEQNYYRPATLTSVIMKCFERVVKDYLLTASIGPLTMQTQSHCTLPCPIWTRGIPM